MGYSNPRININQSLEVINTEARNFNKQFDYEFGKMNDMRIANFKENQKYLEKQKAKKMMGENAWYEMYGKYEPKGGYAERTEAYIKDLHDRYYNSLNCDEPECIDEQRKLLGQAKELSENGGAFAGAKSKLQEAGNITGVSPGGLDGYATPGSFVDILSIGQQLAPVYDPETGHTNYQRIGEDGEPIGDIINGRAFTRSIISGEQSIQTYGDPASIAKQIHKGSYDELGIENLGISEIDKTDPAYQTKVKDYTEARKVYNEAISDPRLYEPTLNNTKEMHRNWPVMVTELVKQASGEGAEAQAAKDALGPLLGGADKEYGTADDSEYVAQGEAGQWDGSDMQRNIALSYFTQDNPLNGIMPPLERQTTAVTKGTGKDKSMTDYQRQSLELSRDKYELAKNKWEKSLEKGDTPTGIVSTMTANERADNMQYMEKVVRDGGSLSDSEKALYEALRYDSGNSSPTSSSGNSSSTSSSATTSKPEDLGTMTSTEFAKEMNTKKLEIGQVYSYTNKEGVKKTFKYNGPNNFEKISETPAAKTKDEGVTGVTGSVGADGTSGS